MENSVVLNVLLLFFGIVIFAAAVFKWDYFFNQRKAQMLTKAIGLVGARIFYAVLGALFTLLGANQLFNLGILNF